MEKIGDPYRVILEMSRHEAIRKIHEFDKTLIDSRTYKNYKLEFRKYPKDCKINNKVYKKGTVYVHGFRYGYSRGRMIGTGKTKEEAFKKAKKYIDDENKKSKFIQTG